MVTYIYSALILLAACPLFAEPYIESSVKERLKYEEITSSKTWTRPTGVNLVNVLCIGGGGGGGNNNGGGGGSGELVFKTIFVTSDVYVTIGSYGPAASTGTATHFGSFLTARAGNCGHTNSGKGGDSYTSGGGGVAGAGGSGSAGGGTLPGSLLTTLTDIPLLTHAAIALGGAASTYSGGGGGGIVAGSITGQGGAGNDGGVGGNAPANSGAGGGGGGSTGGNGGAGYCLVYW